MRTEITGIGSEFQGVGRMEDGRVVFVPGALPGEEIEFDVSKNADRFVEGRLTQITAPSPDRIAPACPLYGRCGGCSAQHIAYEEGLRLKRQIVSQTIERIGGIQDAPVKHTLGSAHPWRYRNKGEYAVATDRATGLPIIGQCEANSHRVVETHDCLIQHELSVRAARAFIDWMRKNRVPAWDASRSGGVRYLVTRVNDLNELMVIVSTTGKTLPCADSLTAVLREATGGAFHSLHHLTLAPRPTHALDGRCRLVSGEKTLCDRLLGLTFELSPQSFFQVNREMTEILYGEALRAAALTGCETVLDAYCGAGTISLAMARQAKRVIGVELNEKAIENARLNAARNGLTDKTEFIAGDAAKEALRLFERGLRPDVICVDPPRKGVEESLLHAMVRCEPKRIVYVSCNPSTLARDLKILLADGSYRLESVQPVDMFSHSGHVENVACLTRGKPGHKMQLRPSPFAKVRSGQKTIELRLFDEKRRTIREGDEITFTNTETGEQLAATVKKLHCFDSFEELYRSLPLLQCGYTPETVGHAHPSDMNQYYSPEDQQKYGVVGIELSLS